MDFIGIILDGNNLTWIIRRKRGAKVLETKLVVDTPTPVEATWVLVARALSVVASFCIPLRTYFPLIDFLKRIPDRDSDHVPDEILVTTTRVVQTLIQRGARRELNILPREHINIYIYSDACTRGEWPEGKGGYGFVIDIQSGNSRLLLYAQAPWQNEGENPDINILEFYGYYFAFLVGQRLSHARIHIYGDNTQGIDWINGIGDPPRCVVRALCTMRFIAETRHLEVGGMHHPGEKFSLIQSHAENLERECVWTR